MLNQGKLQFIIETHVAVVLATYIVGTHLYTETAGAANPAQWTGRGCCHNLLGIICLNV
jgi:glycerol uptake facilitator-like aquaporin